MSNDSIYLDTKNYMNIQSIGSLRGQAKSNPNRAKHEVAEQFESILVQMLIKSMRDANKALTNSEGVDSSQEMYMDLFDKQIAQSISKQGLGFGSTVEHYLGASKPESAKPAVQTADWIPSLHNDSSSAKNAITQPSVDRTIQQTSASGDKQLDFVKNLWGEAKKAASLLGLDPKLLIAQAALETGWGKRIIDQGAEGSSHNLFNIKADPSWDKKSVTVTTLEEREGLMAKEKGSFRTYASYAESFSDYVHFIKTNPRYHEALKEVANPESYIKKLQEAQYATDSNYSNKVLEIYNGDHLNNLLQQAELV